MIEIDRIRSLVKDKGWSLREFFRRLDLHQSTMTAWEAGTASPEKHLPRIALLLDTTEAYLRGETDDPSPNNSDIRPTVLAAHEAQFLRDYMSLSKQGQEHMRMSMYAAVQTFGIKKSGHIPDMEASDEIGV